MALEQLTDRVRQKVVSNGAFGSVITLDLDGQGVIRLDGKSIPPTVTNEKAESDTTVSMSAEILEQLLTGTQDPTLAFMTGKIKVAGNMGPALKLASLLED